MSQSAASCSNPATFRARDLNAGTMHVLRSSALPRNYTTARYLEDKEDYFHQLQGPQRRPHIDVFVKRVGTELPDRDVAGAGAWTASHPYSDKLVLD